MSARADRSTRVRQVDPQRPDPRIIEEAAEVVRGGGLVAFPTETVYGLGADATDPAAVGSIFAAKGRPWSDPLIVHVASAADLVGVAMLPDTSRRFTERFWPGPLTLVLDRGARIPSLVSAGRATVGVRAPAHPVAQALIRAAGRPIAAPSANLFSRPSPTLAEHVMEDLEGRVDLVLDGGATAVGIESTVLDWTVDPPRVLRPGGVGVEELCELDPAIVYEPGRPSGSSEQSQAAPGTLLKHYSPRAEVLLFRGDPEEAPARMRREIRARLAAGDSVGVLSFDEEKGKFDGLDARILSLGPRADSKTAARRLFAALRAFDRVGVGVIVVRIAESGGLGAAVADRLFRAAEGQFVDVAATEDR